MRRFAAPLFVIVATALAACGASTGAPSSPNDVPAGAGPAAPTAGSSSPPSAEAAALLRGMRLDLQERCASIVAGLPAEAVAGLACTPAAAAVDSAAIYLFDTQQAMLGAYTAWLDGNSIRIRDRSPGCGPDSVAEFPWIPTIDDALPPERQACHVGLDGRARGAITLPPFVLVTFEGPAVDPAAVARWAWLGNKDQPGSPTVWNAGGPLSPEK